MLRSCFRTAGALVALGALVAAFVVALLAALPLALLGLAALCVLCAPGAALRACRRAWAAYLRWKCNRAVRRWIRRISELPGVEVKDAGVSGADRRFRCRSDCPDPCPTPCGPSAPVEAAGGDGPSWTQTPEGLSLVGSIPCDSAPVIANCDNGPLPFPVEWTLTLSHATPRPGPGPELCPFSDMPRGECPQCRIEERERAQSDIRHAATLCAEGLIGIDEARRIMGLAPGSDRGDGYEGGPVS